MAAIEQEILDLTAGDTWPFERTYTGLPLDVTITKIYLTFKSSYSDADAAAVYQASITTTETADGQILKDDTTGDVTVTYLDGTTEDLTDGAIAFRFFVESEDLFVAGRKYKYDFQAITSDGGKYTLETKSFIKPLPQVTLATS